MEAVDAVVVGAGVVGLAVARELALSGREVLVLEAGEHIGSGISSRNSEVIHAGLYYPNGSLMARLCVEGRKLLYSYCREHRIAHDMCGKLVVASDAAEVDLLETIAARARSNGVDDLQFLDGASARAIEPALHAEAALLSPSSGIVDSHGLMSVLQGEAENAGAMFAFRAPAVSGRSIDAGLVIDIGGIEPMSLRCRTLVNAAGLGATKLAAAIADIPPDLVPRTWFAKGSYFSLASRAPFRRLIYPVPAAGGLGTHLTLDLAGRARFGPDIEWIDGTDYEVNPARAKLFAKAIRRYWPDLPHETLQPDYAGIRPKISGPGEPGRDFVIQSKSSHGVAGLVNLFGIESPGLTSALAIARYVVMVLNANN